MRRKDLEVNGGVDTQGRGGRGEMKQGRNEVRGVTRREKVAMPQNLFTS